MKSTERLGERNARRGRRSGPLMSPSRRRTCYPSSRYTGTKRPVRDDGSIFVSIAAYRDHMLANTLTELFTHASKPESIIAGVVQQNCVTKCKTGVQVVQQAGRTGKNESVGRAGRRGRRRGLLRVGGWATPLPRGPRARAARERDGEPSGRPSRGISPPSCGWGSSSTSRSTRTCGRGRRGTTSCDVRCGRRRRILGR